MPFLMGIRGCGKTVMMADISRKMQKEKDWIVVDTEKLLADYDQYLTEFAYDKIWSEMSPKEREIFCAMAENHLSDVKTIREKLSMNSSKFSVYRSRLIDKGVLDGQEYGTLKFTLPRFSEYASLRGRVDL